MPALPPRRHRRLAAVAALAAFGVLVGACGNSNSGSPASTTGPGPTVAQLAAATLNGSGSSFQKPFDDEAIMEFVALHSGVSVTYAGGGSGKGLADLKGKLVDFAGSDAPIAAADVAAYGGAGAVLYFPTVVGPITVSYILSGVSKLTLSGSTIAKIFAGKVSTWNDAAIAGDNPGVTLPSTKITPVHRSDSSGTTRNFTLYLSKVDPTDWTFGTGTIVNWPGGATGNTNTGVAQTVKAADGSIGYVDYSDAKAAGLSFASVGNSSGKAIAPSLAGASAAASSATINPDLTYDPTNAPGADAYPITSPTWIVIYKSQADKARGTALKAFLDFILTTGQTSVAAKTDFAPLAGDLLTKAKAQLDQIVIPA
jgi:phosphate transport system substrate-binding protein